MIRSHVDVKPAGSGDLLELTLGTRGTPEVVQSSHHLHHRGDRHLTGPLPQAGVRSFAVVDIFVHAVRDVDLVGIRPENHRVPGRSDLMYAR